MIRVLGDFCWEYSSEEAAGLWLARAIRIERNESYSHIDESLLRRAVDAIVIAVEAHFIRDVYIQVE